MIFIKWMKNKNDGLNNLPNDIQLVFLLEVPYSKINKEINTRIHLIYMTSYWLYTPSDKSHRRDSSRVLQETNLRLVASKTSS